MVRLPLKRFPMSVTARLPFFTLAPKSLHAIAGWREAPFFSDAERAALAWADAVNALPQRDDTEQAFAQLKEHFSDSRFAELSYGIAAIRGWNVLNLSLRNQIPQQPAPGF